MPNSTVVLETTQGVIKIEVFEELAPVTAHEF
jgi:cyclophilin family peptidyl-prolyl cis-trans isomerase